MGVGSLFLAQRHKDMANLGTLMFGADIDLKKLKDSINSAKGDIEKALRITLDTNSYEEVVSRLKKLEEASQKAGKESSEAHQKSAQNAKQEADNTERVTHLTENYRKLLADVANQMANISRIQLDGTKLGIDPTVLSKVSAEYERLWKTITNSMSGTEIFKGFPVLDMSSDQFAKLRAEFNALQSEYKLVTKSANEFNKTTEKANTKAAVQAIKEQTAAAKNAEAENQKWASSMDYARSKANELKNTIEKYENAVKNAKPGIDTTALQNSIEQLKKNLQTLYGMIGGSKMNGTAQDFVSSSAFKVPLDNARHYFATLNEGRTVVTNLTEAEQRLASSIKGSTDSMRGQSQVLNDLKSMAMQYLSVWGAQSFISSIIQTGGLLEQQRMSIGAILGDLSQANHLFGQITQLALKSPFGVVQLDTMSKQLTAYNFKYSELYDWTKRLADISAATGTEVSRLALALGHVRSEGALSGYTLRQFAMGNVPLLQTLSQQLGKTTAEIRKMTREKAITYDDVEKALKTLTDEGGIFANAQEVMSNALNAKFKNLHDAFDIMFGNMAESSVGDVLKNVAETLTVLAKHWKEVGAQVIVVTGAFAAYKAVSATVNAGLLRSGVMAGQYSAKQLELLATTGKLNKQLLLQAVAAGKVSAADAEAAGAVYNLTRAQLDAVAATGKTAAAYDVAAIAGGKFATQTQILASQFKSASWFSMTKWAIGAKLAWTGLTGAFKAATTAVRGFLTTMWPLLALSAVTEVFMRMGQNAEETDKYLKDLSQTANEASKSLGELTKNYSVGSSVGKDSKQLTEDIKEMTEQLKSYSENASETFKNAFAIDSEGKSVHSLAEQYEILAKALDTAKKGYERLGEHSDIISNAIDSVDWQHGHGKIRKFLEEAGSMLFGWMASDTYNANRGSLNDAIENYVNKVREVRLAENELLKDRLSITKALKAAGYQTVDMWSNDEIISVASSIPTYFKESDRAKVEGFWNAIGDSAKDALEKVKDSNAELEKAYALASSKAQAAGKAVFEALSAEYGDDMKKWPAEWRDEVMTALARVTAGVSGFADMSEEQQLRVRNAFMQPFGITLTLDNSEAEKRLTDMQIHLNELVGEDWVIKLHLETVGSFEQLYDQLDKTVKKSNETIKKLGDGFSEKDKARITSMATGVNTLTDKEKEYRDAVLNRQKAITAANKEGFKLSSLEKAANKAATAAHKAETAAEKEAKAKTKMAEAQLKIDEELAKQRLELEDAIADAEVAAIENNAERERAQRELEFKKQKRQLDKQVEEWKKKSFELAKKEHEANPKNKTVSFYDTPVGKAGWRGQSLTSEQEGIYAANLKKINAERKRQIENDDRELVNSHASYIDKKLEIDRKYNEEIGKLNIARREAEKRGDTQAVEKLTRSLAEAAKDRAKEQAKLSLDELKEMPDYVRAFEDLENTSSETLNFLIKKFEEVKQTQAQTLTPTELKEYVDTIQKMTDEIAKRNPFKAIALANEDVAKATVEVTKAERRLAAVKRGMAPVVKIEKSANGQLNAVLLTQAEAEEQLRQAKDKQAKATKTREKVLEELRNAMADFASTLKDLGSTIGGTAGEVIGFIADTVTFVNTASEAMKVASSKATGAMAVIEKGSAIITIIAAVINLLKELNELLPDASTKYQEYADKVSEINKATQAMEAYKIAVMEARMEEEHWFDNSSLGKLPELYNIGRQALDNYNEALMRSQAIYQNAQSGGWLTSFAHWTNPATWFKELFGWDSDWLDALAIFGSGGFGAEAMMGQLGIWLTEHANDDKYKYAEGMIAAIANLRIQTREKSSGFLGTGIGGHAEETEDLIKWVKENLKMDLFDEDFMLNEEAYKILMERYSDKLVGETKATLEELQGLKEKWNEYIESLHEYVKDAYLPLQENYINALWDWFDEGKDVMDGFKDYAKSTFRDIITNMLATILNERYFKKFGETINGLYDQWAKGTLSEEELMAGVASATSGLVTELNNATPVMQGIMTTVTNGFAKAGMSLQNAESAFKDLRSSFLDTLMDMEGDADDFRKKMEEIMVKDLIEKNVFSKAFIIGDEAYKNLDEYITKWNERYADAVAKNDTVLIDQLLDELVKVRELTIKEAEALRERLKDIAEEEDDTTFSGLSDSWVSTLMDMSKTAEDWAEDIGKTMAEKIIKEMVVPTMLQPLLDDLQSVFDTTLANATTTDADGNKTYDWDQVIQSPELFEEIERLTRAYPKAQEIIKKIMDAFGLDTSYYKHEGFSNLADSIIDSLKSVDGSVEDWSKEQGKKMAEQMAQDYVDEIYGSKISELNEAWQKALDNGDDNAMKAIERDLETLYRKMADDPRLQEFIAKFKELADNPFKDMAKEFTQSLMDMEQTTEDFGLSIARNLTEQMIDKIIGDSYQAQIDALGNQWAEALKNGDTAAIERIKQEMMTLRDQMGEAVQPLLDAIREIDEQTDTTFKDMTDSWVSALMDMDKTAEDWAQEVGKMMAQKIITEMIAPVYIQPLLNSMQEAFNNAMAVEGATFKSVMSAMTPFIEDIKEKFDEIRPLIEEIFGGFGIVTEAVEEVEEAVDEVEYALGDLKSEFSSALMDMESTAESFSKNIKNILAKTFVEKFILGEKFDAMMEQWQQQFEGILTGTMSDNQRKKSIQKLADSMTDYEQSLVGPVMSLLESLGLTAESNQEATMNMADKITYDQADQLLGINIAQELTLEQILAELKGGAVIQTSPYKLPVSTVTNDDGDEQLTATLLSMIDLTRIGNDNILSQFTMANDHLRMIQEYQRKINNEVSTHLASIDMKLNNLSRL